VITAHSGAVCARLPFGWRIDWSGIIRRRQRRLRHYRTLLHKKIPGKTKNPLVFTREIAQYFSFKNCRKVQVDVICMEAGNKKARRSGLFPE
jgi:hypothetical protein